MLKYKEIETKTATLFIRDRIVHTIYKAESDVTLEDVEANFKIREQLQKGEKMMVLADVKDIWQFSQEARKFVGGEPLSNLTIAMAIVIGYSMPIRILANFFMKFNQPKTPTKLFNSKEKALEWLNKYK